MSRSIEQVASSAGGKRNRAARVGLSSANVRSDDDEACRLEITEHTHTHKNAHTHTRTYTALEPPLV